MFNPFKKGPISGLKGRSNESSGELLPLEHHLAANRRRKVMGHFLNMLALATLYAFSGRNIFFAFLAIPVYLQWLLLKDKFGARRVEILICGFYCQTFAAALLVYIYSIHYPLSASFYYIGMSDLRRG